MAVTVGTSTFNSAPTSVASTVATWTSKSIGTATSDRLVVLCVGSEFTTGTISSATIDFGSGDTAMTAASQGTLGNNSARIFYLAVTSGTTATFKVTYGANPSTTTTYAAAYAVTGVGSNPIFEIGSVTDTDADPITTGVIPIPTNGALIAIASFATDASARTWTGATEDVDVDAGTFQFTTATNVTGGETTITVSGANTEDCALSHITFLPAPVSFGDIVGVSRNGVLSITNPFSPSSAITISVGDLVFVAINEIASITATTCSDNLGNSYTALTSGINSNATIKGYFSVATTGGACTPSVATTSSTNDAAIVCTAYKGAFAAGSQLDKNPAVLGDSAEPYTANATGTLSQADELIVGYFGTSVPDVYDTPAPSAKMGARQVDTAFNVGCCLTSLVVSSTSTVSMAVSGNNGSRSTVCGVATFKKDIGAPAPQRGKGRPIYFR